MTREENEALLAATNLVNSMHQGQLILFREFLKRLTFVDAEHRTLLLLDFLVALNFTTVHTVQPERAA